MECQNWLHLCAPIFLIYFWQSRWCEAEVPYKIAPQLESLCLGATKGPEPFISLSVKIEEMVILWPFCNHSVTILPPFCHYSLTFLSPFYCHSVQLFLIFTSSYLVYGTMGSNRIKGYIYIRVGKKGSLGPWSRVIVYCSKLSFCQNDSPIGG